MSHPLTLDEVLQSDQPACTEDLVYRYEPSKRQFLRACTIRFAPAWLAVPWPAEGLAWYHADGCECSSCLTRTEAAPVAPERIAVAC